MFQTLISRFRGNPTPVHAYSGQTATAGAPTIVQTLSNDIFAKVVEAHPVRDAVLEIEHFLTNPAHVGFGMAAAAMRQPEPIIRIGGVRHLRAGPDKVVPARWMRTVAGERFGALVDSGFALYEAVPDQVPAGHEDRPLAQLRHLRHDRIDEILFHRPHSLGRRLAVVSPSRVQLAAHVCGHLRAAVAIDLLLSRLPKPATVTCASVHSVGKAKNGGLEAVIMLVTDNATRAFSVAINSGGAMLMAEPSHDRLFGINRSEIQAYETLACAA